MQRPKDSLTPKVKSSFHKKLLYNTLIQKIYLDNCSFLGKTSKPKKNVLL